MADERITPANGYNYEVEEYETKVGFKIELFDATKSFFPWKLHVSADVAHANIVLRLVQGFCEDIWKRPLTWKYVNDARSLQNYYMRDGGSDRPKRGYYKRGKFVTIYAETESELLEIARGLNAMLDVATAKHLLTQPLFCSSTDRPVGAYGLGARDDRAGGSLSKDDYEAYKHADAYTGNYRKALVCPDGIWNASGEDGFEAAIKPEEQVSESYPGNKKAIVLPDPFELEWGPVRWDKTTQMFKSVPKNPWPGLRVCVCKGSLRVQTDGTQRNAVVSDIISKGNKKSIIKGIEAFCTHCT